MIVKSKKTRGAKDPFAPSSCANGLKPYSRH